MIIQFQNWLSAPFLQELSSQEMYGLMSALKDAHGNGVLECALDNGIVSVIHMENGHPREDREKIAHILRRPTIVVAWMPGSADKADSITKSNTYDPKFRQIMERFPLLASQDQWIVVLNDAETISASIAPAELSGETSIAAAVAQINSSFQELLGHSQLQRFEIADDGYRFGFEFISGPWTIVYRIRAENRGIITLCNEEFKKIVRPIPDSDPGKNYQLHSNATREIIKEYAEMRPGFFHKLERILRKRISTTDINWTKMWLKYKNPTVLQIEHDESAQELNGVFQQLYKTVSNVTCAVTENLFRDFVCHSTGTTIWCVNDSDGFFAIEFDDQHFVLHDTVLYLTGIYHGCIEDLEKYFSGNIDENSVSGDHVDAKSLFHLSGCWASNASSR